MILQALCGYYDRLEKESPELAPPFKYKWAYVGTCIVLNNDGHVVSIRSLLRTNGKKQVAALLLVPEQPKKTSTKPPPAFLCDKTEMIFGINEKPSGAEYRYTVFEKLHRSILDGIEDVGAQAMLRFLQQRIPGRFDCYDVDISALKEPANVIFQLQGDECYLHERPLIKDAWFAYCEKKSAEADEAQCLITGRYGAIARLNGDVGGFGKQRLTIVSNNQKSFESYGKRQGENAPISERAAFQYISALNLLVSDRMHCINLHDDKVVFWAEQNAIAEEETFGLLFGADFAALPQSEGLDEAASRRVKATASALLQGKAPVEMGLNPDVRFYLLGMGANLSRLVIRFFHTSTFGELVERVRQHYDDISIISREDRLVTPWRLTRETAVGRKSENVPKSMQAALMRSILGGGPYPYGIFQQMMLRIRAEAGGDAKKNGGYAFSRERVGFIKGYLNRAMRRDGKKEEEMITVALNEQERSPGYVLGRLMALLEYGQKAALGDVNATVVDKYLNSALAAPQNVFSTLLPLFEKHMNKLGKEPGREGSAFYIKRLVGDVVGLLPSSGFPLTLSAEEQGKFIVGYYHQNQALYTKKSDKTEE